MARKAVFHDTGTFDDGSPLDIPAASGLTAHLADTSDAHDASAISIADSGGYFTATDVEAALQELGAGGGGGGGTELDYVEQTSTLTVTATSDATAQTFVSGSAVAYDGSTRICIEAYAPDIDITANQACVVNLYDGSTDLGRIANVQSINATGASGSVASTLYARRFLTPSNATHTFHIKAWKTGGTAHVLAGAGGTATYMPGFIRITVA